MSTSSPEDTPANHLASPDNDKEKTILDTCGHSSEMPFGYYDPDTHSWKMFGVISLWEECPSLPTLPISGITRNGALFRRPPWEPIIDAIGLSLWPTPTSRDHKDGTKPRIRNGKIQTDTLGRAVQIWHIPRAALWKNVVYERSSGKPQNLENQIAQREPSAIGGKVNPT